MVLREVDVLHVGQEGWECPELSQRLHCGMVEWMRTLVSSKTCSSYADSLWPVSDLSSLVSLVLVVYKLGCTGPA